MLREPLLLLGCLDPLGIGAVLAVPLSYALFLCIRRVWELGQVQSLHRRAVLITGCDTGLGRAYAKRLDELGSVLGFWMFQGLF
jgi:hypothetical protein